MGHICALHLVEEFFESRDRGEFVIARTKGFGSDNILDPSTPIVGVELCCARLRKHGVV